MLGLLKENTLKLDKIKHFVLDECDRMLEALGTLLFNSSSSLSPIPPSNIDYLHL
jgi:superfamily II DNA/RNA helicase